MSPAKPSTTTPHAPPRRHQIIPRRSSQTGYTATRRRLLAASEAASQRIGFWGAAPIVQPSGAGQAAVTLGNTDGEIGGLSIGATYSQAEIQALRDKWEQLADDVRALSTLVHALRTAMHGAEIVKRGVERESGDALTASLFPASLHSHQGPHLNLSNRHFVQSVHA